MAMTTSTKVGRLVGMAFSTSSNPTSSEVDDIITEAAQEVLRNITHKVNGWDDRFKYGRIDNYIPPYMRGADTDLGLCNGTNKTFYLRSNALPVADMNDDGSIDSSDVTIVVYDYTNDVLDRSTYTAASIDQNTGKIVLNDAPPNNFKVYANYNYYVSRCVPDSNLLALACSVQTALWIWQNPKADITQIIDSYSAPGISIAKGAQGMLTAKNIDLNRTYLRELYKIINRGRNIDYY
ncbi:MAG: hypothetical protein ACTSPB_02070 [Candidatus Thorarchaeota archaeon]